MDLNVEFNSKRFIFALEMLRIWAWSDAPGAIEGQLHRRISQGGRQRVEGTSLAISRQIAHRGSAAALTDEGHSEPPSGDASLKRERLENAWRRMLRMLKGLES